MGRQRAVFDVYMSSQHGSSVACVSDSSHYFTVNVFHLSRNEVSLHMSPECEGAESETPDQVFDSK